MCRCVQKNHVSNHTPVGLGVGSCTIFFASISMKCTDLERKIAYNATSWDGVGMRRRSESIFILGIALNVQIWTKESSF